MLFLTSMSNDEFSNLMGQLSAEELERRALEEKAVRRAELFRKIFAKFLSVIAVGALGAGIYFHAPIQARIEKIAGRFFPEHPENRPENSPRIKQIQEAAAKRDKTLDEVMK